ncbi:Penicillin-binding protein 4* [Grifola frondosa]|uniref:Penicillin-binding protein 4 n=1 Tax=Grifola frondosa TaxID=5627 RepID=A0A1C7MEM1_GRIFR|nr:Penicillin-binding protein 4* [Grifola frondosa]
MLALWIGLLAFPYARAFLFLGGPVQMPFGTNFSYISPTEELGAARPKPAITPEISSFVEKLLAEHHVPGTSVGVIRLTEENKVNTEFGAGEHVRGWLKNDQRDSFRHWVLLQGLSCKRNGNLDGRFCSRAKRLSAPLRNRWATEKANVRDILNHVSGLPRHDFSYKADDTPADVMRRLRYLKPAYELREQWSYNNQMYVLGAHIISTYSGSPFTSFVKERIFVPLNMSATTYSSREAAQSGLFSQSWTSQGQRRIPFWFDVDSISDLIAGPGGIISSVVDMSKWIATLLNSGVNPETNVSVIPRSTFDETTTAHSIVVGKPPTPEMSILGYGMGWMQSSIQGHQTLSHGGGLPGFLTNVVLFPSDGLGIVALVNSDGPHGIQDIVPSRILADLLGLHQPSPLASNDRPNDRNHTCSTESNSLNIPLDSTPERTLIQGMVPSHSALRQTTPNTAPRFSATSPLSQTQ